MAEQQQLKQHQATCPISHTWVDASAGTGKTKVLTDRFLRFLLNKTPPQNILALTFTKTAASEMKTRILERLSQWAILDEPSLQKDLITLIGIHPTVSQVNTAKALFTEALDCRGGLKIQTIHQFCQELLNRFPLEAGIPLHFTLLDDHESQRLVHQAIDQFLPSEDLSLLLQHYSYPYLRECLGEILTSPSLNTQKGQMPSIREALESFFQVNLSLKPDETIKTFVKGCPDWQDTITLLKDGTASDQKLAHLLTHPHVYHQYRAGFLTQEGDIRHRLTSKKIDTSSPTTGQLLQQEAARIYAFNNHLKHVTLAHFTDALYQLATKAKALYQHHKERHSLLDFDDLILKTSDLLNVSGIAPWVLYKLDYEIDHILVDEAQDTNPHQWEIILKLVEDFFAGQSAREIPRTLFVVGDYKQSIYSFQGAEPALFSNLKHVMAGKAQQVRQRWQNISLDVSFRSCQAILDVVDAVFALQHISSRPLDGGRIELWPLAKEEVNTDTIYTRAPHQVLARQIATQIKHWLDEKRQIQAKGRPLQPNDLMILVQRRNSFMYELIRALKKDGIPVAGPDRMALLDQLYIQDLVAFGRFLLLPKDDYNLACLLKSPLFNFCEEELFDLCSKRSNRSLWAELNQQSLSHPNSKKAQELLTSYLNKVDYLTPYQIFAHLLCASQGRERFFARFGVDIADGLDEFLNLALNFETKASASLELFLATLIRDNPEVKRDFTSGDLNAVRITTVHGAKGLQAPIIFLPDTTFIPKALPQLLWTETKQGQEIPLWNAPKCFSTESLENVKNHYHMKQEEEYRRLLYVALTRAEDELYICGWKNSTEPSANCWYNLIHQAMQNLGAKEEGAKLIVESPQSEPKTPVPQSTPVQEIEEIPPWLFNPAKSEKMATHFLSPSQMPQDRLIGFSPLENQRPQSAQYGQVLHKLLEILPDTPSSDRRRIADQIFKQSELSSPSHDECYQFIHQILNDPQFTDLFSLQSYAEVPIVGQLDGEKYSGQIDRVVIHPNEIKIIDYKSDQNPPISAAFVDQRYRHQLFIYKRLLQQLFPRHKISCQILWIRTKTMMTIPMENEEIHHAAA